MKYPEQALEAAARGNNYQTIAQSDLCGCYCCKSMFHPFTITEWTLDNKAICPNCSTDAVIGNSPTKDFLEELNKYWF